MNKDYNTRNFPSDYTKEELTQIIGILVDMIWWREDCDTNLVRELLKENFPSLMCWDFFQYYDFNKGEPETQEDWDELENRQLRMYKVYK